jgi:hypothetical protein
VTTRANRPGEIGALVSELASPDAVRREAAVARLAVIGRRSVERLLAEYPGSNRETRSAILRALERIGDDRAVTLAASALHDGGDVAVAAAGVLQVLLESKSGASPAALDALMTTALDGAAEQRVRLAAFEALQSLPDRELQRVRAAFGDEAGANPASPSADSKADALWNDATDGHLPDDPASLHQIVQQKAAHTPLSILLRMIEAVRAHEGALPPGARREAWCAVRGSLHQALALRGSRVALYDLRETLTDGTSPLPSSFIAAVHAMGDVSCIEPLAAAYDRTTNHALKPQIAAAFHAIVRRERLTKRHAAVRRIAKSALANAD